MCRFLDFGIKFSVSEILGRGPRHLLEDLQEVVIIGKAHLFRHLPIGK